MQIVVAKKKIIRKREKENQLFFGENTKNESSLNYSQKEDLRLRASKTKKNNKNRSLKKFKTVFSLFTFVFFVLKGAVT